MAKKAIFLIIITMLFFFSLLFTIPIFILSDAFSDYDIIDETLSFYHAPGNISSFERIDINADKANIKIMYVDTNVPYCVKIETNIKLGGSDLVGKSSIDFFDFTWLNSSETLYFSLKQLSNSWFNTSTILIKSVSIMVSIRKDKVLNINATVEQGTIEMIVLYGVSVNNVNLNINGVGDLIYNFYSCKVDGNISGLVNEGYVDIDLRNISYSPNCTLLFTLGNGDLDMNIFQHANLNANVSGIIAINNGDANLRYDDNTNDNGAKIEVPDTGNLNPEILCFGIYGGCPVVGFDVDDVNNIFTSSDLIAGICSFNYNLTFELGEGIFSPHLTSL